MSEYNGHESWTTWNVNLWLNNEEHYYRLMKCCIRATRNRKEAAKEMLEYLPEKTPDGAKYSVHNVMLAMEGE